MRQLNQAGSDREMTQAPQISVLMSVYNAAETLGAAIASILEQSRKDLELIVCDDASTDASWTILRQWADRDSRLILLQNETNLGAGPARNRCLALARGKYTALMDADDFSEPSRLEEQAAVLDFRPDIAFVGTKGRFFSRNPGDSEGCYWYVAEPQKNDFLMTLPFVHASLMFRTEVLRQLGGYSDRRAAKRSEDYELLMRAYAQGFRGINLSGELYAIRLDEAAYQRRQYRYRFNECAVKWIGFTKMGLMPRGIPYALKPLLVGLLPLRLLNWLKAKYYG